MPEETPDSTSPHGQNTTQVQNQRQPWRWPFNILQEEWPEVRKAKCSLFLCTGVTFILGITTTYWLFSYFIIPGKDATIQNLQTQVKYPEQNPVYAAEITNRDNEIGFLSNKLSQLIYQFSPLEPDALDRIRSKINFGTNYNNYLITIVCGTSQRSQAVAQQMRDTFKSSVVAIDGPTINPGIEDQNGIMIYMDKSMNPAPFDQLYKELNLSTNISLQPDYGREIKMYIGKL